MQCISERYEQLILTKFYKVKDPRTNHSDIGDDLFRDSRHRFSGQSAKQS